MPPTSTSPSRANGELLVGSVGWLTEGEDRLAIADKQPAFNPINLIGNQGAVILWVSVFILPFAVALSGMVIVLRRGYRTYADGFVSWLVYTFWGNAMFFFISGIIATSEGAIFEGEVKLIAALASAAIGYGLYRYAAWAWQSRLGVFRCCGAGVVALDDFHWRQLWFLADSQRDGPVALRRGLRGQRGHSRVD